ncbi:hypothetical protein DAPPUDRAFT_242880 [Daphnia pulex]|uniref:Uncharacterized protein n=1 Tax=Daphnia pulex TaxID=6669 RepID=E9GHJ8_DAPPU|nr:hypothetical protein DAPPUDRAFT_242880 [Daphnia pulex]|eukprot:EFX80857.1 hypothetical protein DAPPUDRAFT_242880 [Daphnia pulex]
MSRILSDLENKDRKLNRAFTNGILEGIRNNIRWAEKNLEQFKQSISHGLCQEPGTFHENTEQPSNPGLGSNCEDCTEISFSFAF